MHTIEDIKAHLSTLSSQLEKYRFILNALNVVNRMKSRGEDISAFAELPLMLEELAEAERERRLAAK